ncbi:SDR family NAD(P)-dependent oxidoreductase [Streptomyces sp. NPDC001811]
MRRRTSRRSTCGTAFSVDDWNATIVGELNVPFFVTKFAWPHLVRSGAGVVLDVASVAGSIAGQLPPMVPHCAANAGVVGMTRRLALEGAPHDIRAVSISPGPVSTPASERDLGDDQAARDAVTGKTLLKRFARPEVRRTRGLPRLRPRGVHHRRRGPVPRTHVRHHRGRRPSLPTIDASSNGS